MGNINTKEKYIISYTTNFKKQYKKIIKQGKDKTKLETVLNILISGEKLPKKYRDHALINNKYFNNCRECHIEPDWLLVYEIYNDILVLILTRLGTHSKLSANTVQHTHP